MKKINKKLFFVAAVLIAGLLIGIPGSLWAAEPKAGDVINSGNIEQYKDYFPMFMQRYIKDGWGFEPPVVINVREREVVPLTKGYLKASIDNQKTCKISNDGLVEGYNGQGMPFYEPKEPQLALKVMWNQFYKPYPDDWLIPTSYLSIQKRKGGRPTIRDNTYEQLMFSNRTMVEPIPELNNPKELYYSSLTNSQTPPVKDMAYLTWRYKDPLKYDDMWAYVPTLRRTLRLVSSERSNPIRGSPYTWDDVFGFDGKIPLFEYEYVGTQTVLCLNNSTLKAETVDRKTDFHPITHRGQKFETTDCWVIDIKPKDPRYPQSKKTIWVDKNRYWVIYAQMYDKAGEFWKGFWNASQSRPLVTPYGEEAYRVQAGSGITDFKTFFWVLTITGDLQMNLGANPALFQPGSLGTF